VNDDWKQLADRVRAAASVDVGAGAEAPEARAARLGEAQRAREELLDDLLAFGGSLGVVLAERDGACVRWSAQERSVSFTPAGEGDRIRVDYRTSTPREGRLYREPLLGDKWVLSVRHAGNEDREALFETGLLRLLVQGLRLPDPREAGAGSEAAPASAAPEPSAAPAASPAPRRSL
jgi:hypothetical protein